MEYRIEGDNFQIIDILIEEGELVYSESGAAIYLDDNVKFMTGIYGGFLKGLKRTFIKESLFITSFETEKGSGDGRIGFGGRNIGKIIPLNINNNSKYVIQKGAFLCAERGVNLDIAFTKKFGAGLFGGEGFLFQYLSGNGLAFVKVFGDIKEIYLQKGERIRIDTGLIVGFEDRVKYDITRVRGMKSMLFSGEGLFFSTLEGEGKVILQTLSEKKMKKRYDMESLASR